MRLSKRLSGGKRGTHKGRHYQRKYHKSRHHKSRHHKSRHHKKTSKRTKKKYKARKVYRGGSGGSGGWLSGVGEPVGFSWSGDPSTWPNAGSGCGYTQSNHYAPCGSKPAACVVDPPMQSNASPLVGGKHKKSKKSKKSKKKTMRGGSRNIPLGFSQLTDVYREMSLAPQRWMKTWSGEMTPANFHPNPTSQPIGTPLQSEVYAGSDIAKYQANASGRTDAHTG